MFSKVADPNRELLTRAPLNLVVFSLNYGATEAWGAQGGIHWRESLHERGYSGKLKTAQLQQVTIAIGGKTDTLTRSGHQVAKDDGSTATLYEDALVLEERSYPGWGAYRESLSTILEVAAKQRGIVVAQSISLRYVNALSDPSATSPSYWRGIVSPEFLGAAATDELEPDLKRAVYLITFNDGQLNAELRIGLQPDAAQPGCIAYVFDMEFADTEPAAFSMDGLLGRADALNTGALKLFQRIMSSDYLRESK